MNLLETPLTGSEAVAAFLSTLKPKNGSREIWLKLGHDHFYKAEWTEGGSFTNAYSTKCEEPGNPNSRVLSYEVPNLLETLMGESKATDGGVFFIPTQPQGLPLKECIDSTDDIGLEMDEDDLDLQLKKYVRFTEVTGLEFASLLKSGGKSIHGHLKTVDHLPLEQATYIRRLTMLALKPDLVTDRPHQPMRFPGFFRKEKDEYQELLYYSHSRYSYDEILEGLTKYFKAWGVPMPARIPDEWWSECVWQVLKAKDVSLEARRENLRLNLLIGVDNWELGKEAERIIRLQKQEEYKQLRSSVSTLQGESIIDLVQKICEETESSIFEEADLDPDPNNHHNWEFDHSKTRARGTCLWHDTASNSAWITLHDTWWGYHCPTCTNEKALNAFDYWRLKKTGKYEKVTGWEWVQYAKDFLRENGIEPPEYTPTVQDVKDTLAEIKEIPPPPELDLLKLDESDLPWHERFEEACRVLMKQDRESVKVYYTNEIKKHFNVTDVQIRQVSTDVNTFYRENPTHVGDRIFDDLTEIDNKRTNPGISGLKTGLGAIDLITNGFSSNDLVVIAGPSSTGKTLLAKQMALHIASNYKKSEEFSFIPHVFFSSESSTSELIRRLLCQEAFIEITRLSNGEFDDNERMRIFSSAQRIAESNLFIDGTPEISTSQMRQKLIRLKDEYGCVGSIWVDHFNKLSKPYPQDDRASYSQIADELKTIQKEFNCPMMVLSQLTSAHEARSDHRPNEYDLLFGKKLTQNLDKLLMLYNPEKWEKNSEDAGLIHVIVPKNRDGKTGMIKLEHDFAHMTFKDLPGQQIVKPIVIMPEPEKEEDEDEYVVDSTGIERF